MELFNLLGCFATIVTERISWVLRNIPTSHTDCGDVSHTNVPVGKPVGLGRQ